MSDIEDEVKCSECPNARHGFDRDASHNEGRYVCQCESHKCTAESLRQQLAEANAEIERLNFKLQNQALDCIAADGQAFDSWQQLAASQAREQQLREALDNHIGNYKLSKDECKKINAILDDTQDTAALEALIAKAGERTKGQWLHAFELSGLGNADMISPCDVVKAIRALPAVTLEDLK